jgi:hypothetical protein
MSVYWEAGNFALGGRIPLGLQVWPISNNLEIFFEMAPASGRPTGSNRVRMAHPGGVGASFLAIDRNESVHR